MEVHFNIMCSLKEANVPLPLCHILNTRPIFFLLNILITTSAIMYLIKILNYNKALPDITNS